MDQDNLNLNMFPGFSENLISYKPSPGDLFGYFESNEFAIYDNQNAQNAEENFEDCYHKVFNPFLADNKKNILSEVNEINNVEDFIVHFQKQLDYYYYKKEFDNIIEIIEKRFPYFFNEKTNSFLFILQKLKFFELLRQDKLQEAKLFYKEKLLFLVKEIKKENWEKKNKFFMQLINNPKIILKRGDLQKKYYDQYSYELEKAIRNFLHDDNEIDDASSKEIHMMNNSISMSNSNLAFNHLFSSSSIDLDALIKNNNNNNIEEEIEINTNKPKNEIKKEKSVDEEGKEDLDIENFSTKEEFSDFEDEIQQKCVDVQDKKDTNENTIDTSGFKFIDNNNINNNSIDCEFKLVPNNDNRPDISSPFSPIPSKSFKSSFDDIDNNLINFDKNEFIINTSSKNIQKKFDEDNLDKNINEIKENTNNNIIKIGEINTNINIIQEKNKQKEQKENKKKYQHKKKNKKEETIYNQLPFLNSFKPKYIKRETIDKKVIRSFKNYIIKEHKAKRFEINAETMDQSFFINLIHGNVLPPLNYHDLNNDEYIKFNSFNCSYLLWFFGKKGIKEIYNQFINEKGKEFIFEMTQYYEIPTEEEKNQLNSYIMNLPNIFDISLVNNITQGTGITHLYRTVDKNKILQERERRKKNDLDLKRLKSNESQFQRERSRSRDFDNSD